MKNIKAQALTTLTLVLMASNSVARDISGGINSLQGQIKPIALAFGMLAMVVVAVMFIFRKDIGFAKLQEVLLAAFFLGAGGTIFMMVYNAFN